METLEPTRQLEPPPSGDGQGGSVPELAAARNRSGRPVADRPLSDRQVRVLLTSVLVVATCGLLYELIVGTLSSYLLGNSILHFSLTIGGFMTAMGIGSLLSRRVTGDPLVAFVAVELAIGVAGGGSALALYAAYSYAPIAYHVVMAAAVLVIGVLVGLEIPLVARVLDAAGRERRHTVADVLAVDYLGALVAALAFPLLLLPTLGVLRTAFVTGAINLGVVVACLWAFRRPLRGAWRPLALATLALAIPLVAGAFGAGWLSQQLEAKLYRAPIIYTEQSPYQRLVVTKSKNGDTRLFLDGALQFATSDEYRYHESLVHPAMALAARRQHVLVLGGGDGLAVREILKWDGVEQITLVDLDPAVTELAQRHPAILEANEGALSDPRVEIVSDDAYRFIEDTASAFDVVIVDLPDPNHESLAKLYSRPFYEMLRQRLGMGAMVAVQSTSPYFAREAFWSIVATAEAADLHPVPYHVYVPSFGDWGFFLGSTHAVNPERFGLPNELTPRFLTPREFEAAQTFSPDIDRLDVNINTLDDPILLRYYQHGWARWE
ncbi:MAG: polyamine aminopropyltransferase [Bacteroidota bacterium]